MTQSEFDKLPGLLTPSQFMGVTGLSRHKLREESEAGALQVYRARPRNGRRRAYRKYFKRDAARLSGFEMR
jgi:hypothetical protein